MVKLKLFSGLRDLVGAKEVEIEADGMVVRDALRCLADQYGDKARQILFDQQGELWPSILLLINGEAAEHGPDTKIKDGDVISVLLPTAGG